MDGLYYLDESQVKRDKFMARTPLMEESLKGEVMLQVDAEKGTTPKPVESPTKEIKLKSPTPPNVVDRAVGGGYDGEKKWVKKVRDEDEKGETGQMARQKADDLRWRLSNKKTAYTSRSPIQKDEKDEQANFSSSQTKRDRPEMAFRSSNENFNVKESVQKILKGGDVREVLERDRE